MRALDQQLTLNERERRVLGAAHVGNAEELSSLLWNFPALAVDEGIDAARLSDFATPATSRMLTALADVGIDPRETRAFPTGAEHAADAPWPLGETVVLEDVELLDEATAPVGDLTIDKLALLPAPWPARDQGRRGTCVAFAATALVEFLQAVGGAVVPDHSEQFLYWAIKRGVGDRWPHQDGTVLERARAALAAFGICSESDWPYDPLPRPGNVSHETPTAPSAHARHRAGANLHHGIHQLGVRPAGNAATVLAVLRECRPVAVSLPVFSDRLRPDLNNWNSPVSVTYGKVLDPPPTAVVTSGHAICVVGFAADASEPTGGHFVIRNSWGRGWGAGLPAGGFLGPEPGYGQVSATYVDRFLWEMYRL